MEMLYQYLWKHRMLGDTLQTVDGKRVDVLSAGTLNNDSGPDFSGARLRLDGEEWCGNVEVHVKASDWRRHGHSSDPAYGNVILHVVAVSDERVAGPGGNLIPQVTASFPESFIRLYATLAQKITELPCGEYISGLHPLVITDWLSSLTVERMQLKARRILDVNRALGGDWERTCFVTLARALGFGLNSEPLEMTARAMPLKILLKHSDNIMQLESLLLGQGGMLDSSVHIFDEYYQGLCREYFFLARKYGLRPLPATMWKFSKTRPQNFPSRRLAMLAAAVAGGFGMMSRLTDMACGCDDPRTLFDWKVSPYWKTHFDFDVPGSRLSDSLSEANVSLLLINFAAPLLYARGAALGDPELAERGLDMWDTIEPENNRYIRRWHNAGIRCRRASDSQALIQLSREYCEKSRCLDCRFANALLRRESHAGMCLDFSAPLRDS